MDCKDLMVGDWFKSVDYNSPFRITAIYDDVVQTQADYQSEIDGNWYSEAEIKDLVPIKLTDEILVKNGFTYEEDTFLPDTGYWSLSNEDGLLYFTINAFGVKGSGEVAFGYQDIALKYVHQLQNLLVIAGVEKEIEL